MSRGAVLDKPGGLAVDFGDTEKELTAFANSAALIDRTSATCLVQEGSDALDLLHRLTTNDLLSLEPGNARFTVLTSERGRIIDVLQVVLESEDRLLLLSESSEANRTMDWIEKFTIIEDSEVRNASDELARIAVIGPEALQIVNDTFGIEIARDRTSGSLAGKDGPVIVASQWAGNDRVDVVIPRANVESVWDKLVAGGAVPAGATAYQAARIDNGVPLAEFELTEDSNPLEVKLKDLISFSKGCYVGQEVVARLDTYDKLQRRLVAFESDSPLSAGANLSSDGKRAGSITSVSSLSADGKFHALGFARREFWTSGTVLEVSGGTVIVRELNESATFS